jgi:CPA1 family monovalent cation:H+ antiporter
MTTLDMFTLLLCLIATLPLLAARLADLPAHLGLRLAGIVGALGMLACYLVVGEDVFYWISGAMNDLTFNKVLVDTFLGVFAFGALMHLPLSALRAQAARGVALSAITFVLVMGGVAALSLKLASGYGFDLPLLFALILGAAVAAADPLTLDSAAPKKDAAALNALFGTQTLLGLAIVFTLIPVLHGLESGHTAYSVGSIGTQAVTIVGLSVLFGGALGAVSGFALKHAEDGYTALPIALATVGVGVWLAQQMPLSAPMALGASGVMVATMMGDKAPARALLAPVWHLMVNLLFVAVVALGGMELLMVNIKAVELYAGLALVVPVFGLKYLALKGAATLGKNTLARAHMADLLWRAPMGLLPLLVALSLTPSAPRESVLAMAGVLLVTSVLAQVARALRA